jgi:HTH-type transcriptional regulator / antitoxin MqsA
MKCSACSSAELAQDTRDTPHVYKAESTTLPAVKGDFCPACPEAVLAAMESR